MKNPVLKYLNKKEKKERKKKKETLSAPTPKCEATINMFSVNTDLPVLDISFKWNLTICVPL
jgi:hypothetical protein